MQVRRILEDFSAELPKRAPVLTEAYGIMLFKCPIIHCTRFYQGFATRQQRDKHVGQHERAHKCTNEGCDYRELGFPTEGELRKHVELCHRVLPEEPTFPKVQRVNLGKALNDAIDRDDVEAVRDICSGTSECPLRQTGFVLRAMKRRSITTALVLVELLGTDVEMNQVDSKGRTVLHEAVEIRNDGLIDRILDTGIKVDVRDHNGITPYWSALKHGYFHAIRSLMDHPAVDLIPQKHWQANQAYLKGLKEAAAAGIDDILKAQFSNFVTVSQSYWNYRFDERISDDLSRIIAKAASNGHESTVQLILGLSRALDLEKRYIGLLKKESHNGIEAMAKFLMQRYGGAKPEIGKDGKTHGNVLANAARKDDPVLVMRLLTDGADIDYATPSLAYNALGAASSRGNLSMVTLLVEQGADVNAKGGYSGNALYLACCGGHMDVVNFLFEKGADVNARIMGGDTALIGASEKNRLDAVQFLVEKAADVNIKSEYGEIALLLASRDGYKEIVEILLQGGADVNLQNKFGETALFKASRYGYKEIVEILLQGGADVNLQSGSGQTALFVAFEGYKRDVAYALIKAEVDIEVKDSHQRTALWQAAEKGWEEIVQILVDRGAHINTVNANQETALLIACREGHVEVVKTLIRGEADVELQNRSGETALSTASLRGYKEIVEILDQVREVRETPLFVAFGRGDKEAVHILIKDEVDIEVKDSHRRTALWQAAENGWEDTVQILIDRGADIHVQNRSGESALFAAYRHGHKEIIRILLASGAEISETALSKALMTRQGDILQLLLKQASRSQLRTAVQMLVDDSSTVATTGGVYDEALCLACSHGMEEPIEVLLEVGAQLTIPVEIYDRALGLIGSRKYVLAFEYQRIAKLLRERRALAATQDLDNLDDFDGN